VEPAKLILGNGPEARRDFAALVGDDLVEFSGHGVN